MSVAHVVRRSAPGATGGRVASGESGATLIIAILFMTVIVMLVVGLLGFAQAGARSHRAYEVERTNRLGVDAAINAGIQYLVIHPEMGATDGPTCYVQVGIEGDVRIVTGNSYYVMKCEATKPSATGALSDSGKVVNGVQNPRDVTITISCGHDSSNPVRVGYVSCGTGTLTKVATARVRFERDTSPGRDPAKSAVIPKVLSWELRD